MGRAVQHRVWPVIEWRQRRHVAVVMDQHAVGGEKRVWDGFWSLLENCGVVAGLGSAGGLADGAQGLQFLPQGPLGGLRVRAVGWQC